MIRRLLEIDDKKKIKMLICKGPVRKPPAAKTKKSVSVHLLHYYLLSNISGCGSEPLL